MTLELRQDDAPEVPTTGPKAEILAVLATLDLPPARKAEAIAAYLKACGWRAPAGPPQSANKRLPSPEPQDMS